jgi:hypothetical protein
MTIARGQSLIVIVQGCSTTKIPSSQRSTYRSQWPAIHDGHLKTSQELLLKPVHTVDALYAFEALDEPA